MAATASDTPIVNTSKIAFPYEQTQVKISRATTLDGQTYAYAACLQNPCKCDHRDHCKGHHRKLLSELIHLHLQWSSTRFYLLHILCELYENVRLTTNFWIAVYLECLSEFSFRTRSDNNTSRVTITHQGAHENNVVLLRNC
jgi:hypothetical protein